MKNFLTLLTSALFCLSVTMVANAESDQNLPATQIEKTEDVANQAEKVDTLEQNQKSLETEQKNVQTVEPLKNQLNAENTEAQTEK